MRVDLLSLESFYDNSLALDYLSGYARTRNFIKDSEVKFRTLIQRADRDKKRFQDELFDDLGDVIGFNTYIWNVEASIKAAQNIKREKPNSIIVFGGMEATYTANSLLNKIEEIDFIVIGEGEVTFAELLERIIKGDRFIDRIPGLAYRSGSNVINGGIGATVKSLDDIPSPFQNPKFKERRSDEILYESYRGCAFSCGFCLYHRDYTKQRNYSLERVAADINALKEAGCSHIRFVDSTFNINRGRVKSILKFLDGIQAKVSVEVSAEFFDTETIEMLPRAGIRHVDIGLQSTNRAALAAVNREWYREESFQHNLFQLRDNPALTLNVELIAGLPADDYDGFKNSVDETVLLFPDHISIYRLLGLKGTAVELQKEKYGLLFSPKPPYQLLESYNFTPAILKKIELLTFSHLILFNLGIGRFVLKYFLNLTKMKPTAIYERFQEFVLEKGLYDIDEAILLSRFYAYGNRFDRVLPSGLHPERIREVVEAFFINEMLKLSYREPSRLVTELIDYGFQLGLLDFIEDIAQSVPFAAEDEPLIMAPWCKKIKYSLLVLKELHNQENNLGELLPEEISSIIFFIHPDFGPATLAIDKNTDKLLETFKSRKANVNSKNSPHSLNELFEPAADGAFAAVEQLKKLHILISEAAPFPIQFPVAANPTQSFRK